MNPPRLDAALDRLPALVADHVLLSAAAMLLGLAVALPLAVAAARRPALARVALGFASFVQTIPALALLALFFPILLTIGGGVPALGFLPALLALALYALLPILRNTVTGLTGIDPAIVEAADGVGMTAGQKLRLVEAPLALPVAMAGVRTAAVWTVGAATLATTVGQPSLGDLIFSGLQTQDWVLVLTGCLAAALALAVDALLGLIETGLRTRRRWLWTGALGVLAAGLVAATWPKLAPAPPTVIVGAKNFSEQFILARLIGRRLEAAGYRVQYREGLGSAVIYRALASGEIDVYVDYSGTLWANEMKRSGRPAPAAMNAEIGQWIRATSGAVSLGSLGFENAYAFAMRGDRARALNLADLDDLGDAAPRLTFGSDLEFVERPEWRDVETAYALDFGRTRMFAPTFMYDALASGDADVISAFSSDGRIAADGLVVLADPKRAIPGYDALLLVSPKRAVEARFAAALQPLVGAIPVEIMREANYRVDRPAGKQPPDAVAEWLDAQIERGKTAPVKSILLRILMALALLLPAPAFAQITVAFYSREFGTSFPHAYFTVKGADPSGAPIDTNYGFTAKNLSPAILMGPVLGKIEVVKPDYIEGSDWHFAVTVNDAQYAGLMALVEEWRNRPGKSYDLNKRNCVHFVGEAAQLLGYKVVFDPKLMKKPRSFLQSVVAMNPGLKP